MPIFAAILKNGGHFELSSGKRDFPNKETQEVYACQFWCLYHNLNGLPYHLLLFSPTNSADICLSKEKV